MPAPRPPRLAVWLLSHFRPRGDLDLLLGDLEEEFHDIQHRAGQREAHRWFWRQTFRSLPGLSFDFVDWKLRMLKTYLLIALRHLKRHTGYSAINIVGLAVGLAACLLIGLFVVQKLAYDRFHPNAEHIYRVYQDNPEMGEPTLSVPFGLAYSLETQLPSIEATTELRINENTLFTLDDTPIRADAVKADSNFFAVFDGFQILRGNPSTLLTAPNRMVVTERFAKQHFGNLASAVGQTIRVDGKTDYEIMGVVATPSVVSHFDFDVLLSLSERELTYRYREVWWQRFTSPIYMKVRDDVTAEALQAQLADFKTSTPKPDWIHLRAQPLLSIHLHSPPLNRDVAPQSDIRYLYLFGAIGLLILLMATINYVNLATARAVERCREVGVRKALGARRGELIQQFLLESSLVVGLALVVAIGLIYIATPWVNQMTGERLSLAFGQQSGMVLLGVVAIGAVVALVAGSYPAFYLSRSKPARVLKGRRSANQRSRVRHGLIVFQLAMSVLLAVGTLLIHQQLHYIQHQDLGFDQEQVVSIQSSGLGTQYEAFKATLLQSPAVAAVSAGSPLGLLHRTYSMDVDPDTPGRQELDVLGVDAAYADVMRPRLLEGRWFSDAHPTDIDGAVVLAETAARVLDLGEHPIGQSVEITQGGPRTVIGLVEDIHNASLHIPMRATAFYPEVSERPWSVLVRFRAGATEAGLAHLDTAWSALVPERPVDFQFVADRIAQQYQREQRLAKIFSLFAGLALLIACLGLFGLAAFLTTQRTKEISLRKVLGATTLGLVAMLSRTYATLIFVGFALAIPLAIWAGQQWLQAFAYHITLSPWIFAGALAGVTLLALGAVASQAWRATRLNPADALRHT
ncbi:MAG: ABC transporter permease [Rhodothermales bacterium]